LKQLDRFNLIDTIGRELQSRMTYSDIDVYLKGFGIDVSKPTSGANSKWVYTKEILADVPSATILEIADELEIEHGYVRRAETPTTSSSYWAPNQFRLFLSHLASFKRQTYLLKKALTEYGISGFVAHESIEPTQEWQDEIEKALFSMDALAAILMPGVKESNWIDQELGVAIGRDVLVVPIIKGIDPYGFLGKVQGLQSNGKTVAGVAELVFSTISTNPKTKGKMARCLVNLMVTERDSAKAKRWLDLLSGLKSIHPDQLLLIQKQLPENANLVGDKKFLKNVNKLLTTHGQPEISISKSLEFDDDIPF